MAPPQAIPILGQMKDTSVQAPHLWSSGGCNIWLIAPGLTLLMVQGIRLPTYGLLVGAISG